VTAVRRDARDSVVLATSGKGGATMTDPTAIAPSQPIWVDLSSSDAAASREFYANLFGWAVEVNDDPQYGGYAVARLRGEAVAGIGPAQDPGMPTVWSVYIGTQDADATATRVTEAGGTVVAPPFDVGDQGRMAVFQDATGAFISAWQPLTMPGFEATGPGTFVWAELNARGFEQAARFYGQVFGWTTKETPIPDGPTYIEFQRDGQSIAGGMEMSPMIPAEVPSYWMPYFGVADVDASFQRALEAGAQEMVQPTPFPGGHFAIVSDPQGAVFGMMQQQAG
jgi:uncharacterized protein